MVAPSITSTAIVLGLMGVSSNIVISSSIGDAVTVGMSYIAFGMFMCLLRIVIDHTRSRGGMKFFLNLLTGGTVSFVIGFGLYSVGTSIEYHLSLAILAIFIGEDILMMMIKNGQSYISGWARGIYDTLKDFRDYRNLK